MTPHDAARLYISRGWCPVPIPLGQKGPLVQGWQHLRIGLEEVEQHFGAVGNIGLILGPPSCEVVDIDLDCMEAIELADQYLPPTGAQFGRVSKPRAHRFYIAPGAAKEAFSNPLDGSTLLELRAAGRDGAAHQTVVPPSIHESGELVAWHGDIIAPAVIDATVLRSAVAWLAIGALVRRHVSSFASEHPGHDLPDLLEKVDPRLGEAARRWLGRAERHARTAKLRPKRQMSPDELDLADVVAAIPNNADWDQWNAMGLAIHAVTGGRDHGAVLFDDWSAKSPKYNPYITAHRWQHFHRSPPSRTGFGKLITLALKHGFRSNKTAGGRRVG